MDLESLEYLLDAMIRYDSINPEDPRLKDPSNDDLPASDLIKIFKSVQRLEKSFHEATLIK